MMKSNFKNIAILIPLILKALMYHSSLQSSNENRLLNTFIRNGNTKHISAVHLLLFFLLSHPSLLALFSFFLLYFPTPNYYLYSSSSSCSSSFMKDLKATCVCRMGKLSKIQDSLMNK